MCSSGVFESVPARHTQGAVVADARARWRPEQDARAVEMRVAGEEGAAAVKVPVIGERADEREEGMVAVQTVQVLLTQVSEYHE